MDFEKSLVDFSTEIFPGIRIPFKLISTDDFIIPPSHNNNGIAPKGIESL
jgi:hypothetical protein